MIAAQRMRIHPSTLLLGLLFAACSAPTQNVVATTARPAVARVKKAAPPAGEVEAAALPERELEAPSLAVGDFIVRRFSGRARGKAALLTERVIAVKDASIVIEVTRESGAETRVMRVELSEAPATRGEIVGVLVVKGGEEIAMGKAAYDALMKDTLFAADENEGQIESVSSKLDVRGRALDCTETKFRVKVRGRQATMRTTELSNSPWGEVSAEVKTEDGTVLYRAEVVDIGHDELRTAAVQQP
jgi:hypothetical protein